MPAAQRELTSTTVELVIDLASLIGSACDAETAGTAKLYLILEEPTLASVNSEAIDVLVDLEPPLAPVLDEATGGDGRISLGWTDEANVSGDTSYTVYWDDVAFGDDDLDAVESVGLLPAYRAYHKQVAAYVAELRARFPGGALLIDVHGQAFEPATTFRGTRAGLTATRLVDRFGPAALQGSNSITGILAARGYGVHPLPDAPTLREEPRFAGGHTVFAYGSHRPDGIDAIQLEFGRQHRADARLPEDLASAIVGFMKHHGLAMQ